MSIYGFCVDETVRERVYALYTLRLELKVWFEDQDSVDLCFTEASVRFPDFQLLALEMFELWQGIKPVVRGPLTPLEFLEILWLGARQASFSKQRKAEAQLAAELPALQIH